MVRVCLAVLVLAIVVAANASPPGQAAPAPVSIRVTLSGDGGGTFRMSGALTDRGGAAATRTVSRGRLLQRQRLAGAKGTLVLSSTQGCARTRGTWRILSGTGAYDRATGGGVTSGRIGCSRPFKPTTVVHTGALTLPPLPLAPAGTYRGWTTQDKEVSFDVRPDGRALVNVLFGGYGADCVQQQGLRRVEWSGVDIKVAGPVPIAEDRSFALELGAGSRTTKVSGHFTGVTAAGTISITYEWNAGGHFWKCAANVPWTVTTPPPPPWQALAGKYCGLTPGGEGVCLDVPAGGREVRNIDAGVLFRCGDVDVVARLTIEGPVPLRSDLSFQMSLPLTLADASTRVLVSGEFDRTGSMTGRLSVPAVTFTHQGTRYTCSRGGAGWTAKRQT